MLQVYAAHVQGVIAASNIERFSNIFHWHTQQCFDR